MEKLIIESDIVEKEQGVIVRISKKANALIDDISKKSGRSKCYIVSKMVEYFYDYVEIKEPMDEE